jgi:pyrroline-5-carboxylate reductase
MNMKTIGIIGCGVMGSAIAASICKGTDPRLVYVSDADTQKAADFAHAHSCHATSTAAIASQCDWIFLAVKPQTMPSLFATIAPLFSARKTPMILVSMAAGLSIAQLTKMAGGAYPIIRMMPNTPALVGCGMILYTPNPKITPAQQAEFCEILRHAGQTDAIAESQMDAAGALSGCGPAYVALIADALADGAVQCGIPKSKALAYAWQTILGTAELALQSGQHPDVLKDSVCSPGGTTICGVRAMEKGAVRDAMMEAVCAAYRRSLELGK